MKPWKNKPADGGNLNTRKHYDELIWAGQNGRWNNVRAAAFAKNVYARDKVVDLGAGCFGMAQWCAINHPVKADYLAVDFSQKAADRVKEEMAAYPNFAYFVSDVFNNGLLSHIWDVVFAGELIEHFDEPAELVKEMDRLCKPGGKMVISTVEPNCEDSIRNGCVYPEHMVEFTKEDLIGLFEPYGTVEYERVGNYHMIYCTKRA